MSHVTTLQTFCMPNLQIDPLIVYAFPSNMVLLAMILLFPWLVTYKTFPHTFLIPWGIYFDSYKLPFFFFQNPKTLYLSECLTRIHWRSSSVGIGNENLSSSILPFLFYEEHITDSMIFSLVTAIFIQGTKAVSSIIHAFCSEGFFSKGKPKFNSPYKYVKNWMGSWEESSSPSIHSTLELLFCLYP